MNATAEIIDEVHRQRQYLSRRYGECPESWVTSEAWAVVLNDMSERGMTPDEYAELCVARVNWRVE